MSGCLQRLETAVHVWDLRVQSGSPAAFFLGTYPRQCHLRLGRAVQVELRRLLRFVLRVAKVKPLVDEAGISCAIIRQNACLSLGLHHDETWLFKEGALRSLRIISAVRKKTFQVLVLT